MYKVLPIVPIACTNPS